MSNTFKTAAACKQASKWLSYLGKFNIFLLMVCSIGWAAGAFHWASILMCCAWVWVLAEIRKDLTASEFALGLEPPNVSWALSVVRKNGLQPGDIELTQYGDTPRFMLVIDPKTVEDSDLVELREALLRIASSEIPA